MAKTRTLLGRLWERLAVEPTDHDWRRDGTCSWRKCRNWVQSEDGIRVRHAGQTFLFCSEACTQEDEDSRAW